MISFMNDYSEGAHESVLASLANTNFTAQTPYGEDTISERAKDKIRAALGSGAKGEIHFLVGGTQTNLVVCAAALRPHEGVVCVESGHINQHETGAIEATGHKVIALQGENGKLRADTLRACLHSHFTSDIKEHIVKPGMVYISQATELGTVYTKRELRELSEVCREYGVFLYVDGARLGCALAARDNDLTLADFAELTDAFYIGGTKNGALIGEALYVSNQLISRDIRYIIKQRGALLAKGWVIGTQFDCLFTDRLYFALAEHSVKLAERLTEGLRDCGIAFLAESTTNQVFPILTGDEVEALSQKYSFELWENIGEMKAIRLCTSWATEESAVESVIKDIRELRKN